MKKRKKCYKIKACVCVGLFSSPGSVVVREMLCEASMQGTMFDSARAPLSGKAPWYVPQNFKSLSESAQSI